MPPGTENAESQWARKNREMFDVVSRRYDLLNLLLSFGLDRHWRRRTVDALRVAPGRRFLDVGSGTADVALAIARSEPRAQVVGVDPSKEMLLRGREKIRAAGLSGQIELVVGDGALLGFAHASFDGVVSAFCIRNLADRPKAFCEAKRLLRPGGRLVALELTRPTGRLLRDGHRIYNAKVVPLLGRLVSDGTAYQYLNDSIAGFPEREVICAELQGAGFVQVTAEPLTGGVVTLFSGQSPPP